MKWAWTGDALQEKCAEGGPQSNGAGEISVNVVKGHVRPIKLAVDVCSHSMHRPSAVGRDGKTVYERIVGRRAGHPWESSVSEYGGCLQPSTRPLGLQDSRSEQGRDLGSMDGSNTVPVWHCQWSGEGPNNQTIAAERTMDWLPTARSTRQ